MTEDTGLFSECFTVQAVQCRWRREEERREREREGRGRTVGREGGLEGGRIGGRKWEGRKQGRGRVLLQGAMAVLFSRQLLAETEAVLITYHNIDSPSMYINTSYMLLYGY